MINPNILIPGKTAEQKMRLMTEKDPTAVSGLMPAISNSFLKPREIMLLSNKNQEAVVEHLLSEIIETLLEHGKEGVELDALELQKELMDIYVLATSLFKNTEIENALDFAELAYLRQATLLQLGQASNVYERLAELVYGVLEDNNALVLNELKALMLSLTMNLPVEFMPSPILATVLEKNERNYPPPYFKIYDPILKRNLSEMEQTQKFVHVKKALRLLRDSELIDQHQHFAFLIHDFVVSDSSLQQLENEIKNCVLPRTNNGKKGDRFWMAQGEEYQVSTQASGLVVASK